MNGLARRVALLSLLLGLNAASLAAEHIAAPAHKVAIEAVQFQPAELTVHSGERIVWTNRDPFPHTVTADAKTFDSHTLAPGKSWSYVAGKPGEYRYSCTLHPTMKGKIIVK